MKNFYKVSWFDSYEIESYPSLPRWYRSFPGIFNFRHVLSYTFGLRFSVLSHFELSKHQKKKKKKRTGSVTQSSVNAGLMSPFSNSTSHWQASQVGHFAFYQPYSFRLTSRGIARVPENTHQMEGRVAEKPISGADMVFIVMWRPSMAGRWARRSICRGCEPGRTAGWPSVRQMPLYTRPAVLEWCVRWHGLNVSRRNLERIDHSGWEILIACFEID